MRSPSDISLFRNINCSAVFLAVRRQPGMSRAELAASLGLAKSAVGQFVDRLIEGRWLKEGDTLYTPGRGRPPTPLSVDSAEHLIIGADVTAERAEVIVSDLSGDLREQVVREFTSADATTCFLQLAEMVAATFERVTATGASVCGLGVSVPGLVKDPAGVLRYSEQTGWRDVDVRGILAKRCGELGMQGMPIVVQRAIACRAQHLFNQQNNESAAPRLYVHIGHTIGFAVVMGKVPMTGHQGFAGWSAHMQIEPEGALCRCGRRGCANVSLTLQAIEIALNRPVVDIATLLAVDDPRAVAAVEAVGERLGGFLYNLHLQFDPEEIAVGGPAFELSRDFFGAAQRRLSELLAEAGSAVPLRMTHFDRHRPSQGAASVLLERVLRGLV